MTLTAAQKLPRAVEGALPLRGELLGPEKTSAGLSRTGREEPRCIVTREAGGHQRYGSSFFPVRKN